MSDSNLIGSPLAAFLGEWRTEGKMLPASANHGADFSARDSYEWLPGRHFLVHRWDAQMPHARIQGMEVIGRDGDGDGYFMHSYDSFGNAGVMKASVSGDVWLFSGDSMRFRGAFRDKGQSFSGTWEMRDDQDGNWAPWMSVTLNKRT